MTGRFINSKYFDAKMTSMVRWREHENRHRLGSLDASLCAFVALLLVVLHSASSGQLGSIAAPIEVSSKEADDNLQVKTLRPEYPLEAKAKGIEGTVRLRITIDERGNVTDARSLSGNPLLIPAAIALVRRYPYRPFTDGGKRVVVTTVVDVPFALHPVSQKEIYDSWMSHLENARQLRKKEMVDAAIGELQAALADAKKLGQTNVAETYGDMAGFFFKEGRYSDAEPFLKRRLEILQHSQVQEELEIANTQADLAAVYLMQKNIVGAQQLLQYAIPVQEKYLKRATLQFTKDIYAQRLALSLGSSAILHDVQGEFSTAEALYKRAISLGEHSLPADDEANIMRRYAAMLDKMGQSDGAAKLREDATALQLGLSK